MASGTGDNSELSNRSAELLDPATPDLRVRRVFSWYSERLLRRSFATVRAMPGSVEFLSALDPLDEGVCLVMSHTAWWDPIVGAMLWRRAFPSRSVLAPMDRKELARFRFMRKLGLFGIDPDRPGSMPAMLAYLESSFATMRKPTLAVTPQGRFTDVREPLRIRPGAAAAIARLGFGRAVAIAVEYGFWNDKKPEVFLRCEPIERPARPTTSQWHRAIESGMRCNGDALALAVRARDPNAFVDLIGGRASVHPVYDAWLWMTGRGRSIETQHRVRQQHAAPLPIGESR